MATIYKRKDCKGWQVDYVFNGKRNRKYMNTLAGAHFLLAEVLTLQDKVKAQGSMKELNILLNKVELKAMAKSALTNVKEDDIM